MRILQPPSRKTSQITAESHLDMNGYGIQTDNLLFKELDTIHFCIRDRGDTTYRNLAAGSLYSTMAIGYWVSPGYFNTRNVDGTYVALRARESGVGLAEVARLQGAVDPYFQLTRPVRLYPSTEPGTPVEGHFLYDSAKDVLKYRDANGFRSVIAQLGSRSGIYHSVAAPTNRSSTATSATKIKEIKVFLSGTFEVAFTLWSTGGATVYGQVYRNGVAIGTLRSTTSTTSVEFTEDISGWEIGDLCQLYIYASAGETVNTGYLTIRYEPEHGIVLMD